MLNEIVESARALTGARYAALVTIDEQGQPPDFLTSGITEQAHRAMLEWSDGPRLFAFFRDLEGPLRIADVPSHVRALGFSPDRLPWGTFQGTPMRHRGVHVGNFYLVEKTRGVEFTDDDEEVLVVLAAQAAAAIAHARAYRQERRARADLEALVDTSPVGVVVFDATTGAMLSLNREARHIVEDLRLPGHGVEELLRTITCRRPDGREIALAELSLAAALSTAETVRAEEIELCGAGSEPGRDRRAAPAVRRSAGNRRCPRRARLPGAATHTAGFVESFDLVSNASDDPILVGHRILPRQTRIDSILRENGDSRRLTFRESTPACVCLSDMNGQHSTLRD